MPQPGRALHSWLQVNDGSYHRSAGDMPAKLIGAICPLPGVGLRVPRHKCSVKLVVTLIGPPGAGAIGKYIDTRRRRCACSARRGRWMRSWHSVDLWKTLYYSRTGSWFTGRNVRWLPFRRCPQVNVCIISYQNCGADCAANRWLYMYPPHRRALTLPSHLSMPHKKCPQQRDSAKTCYKT